MCIQEAVDIAYILEIDSLVASVRAHFSRDQYPLHLSSTVYEIHTSGQVDPSLNFESLAIELFNCKGSINAYRPAVQPVFIHEITRGLYHSSSSSEREADQQNQGH